MDKYNPKDCWTATSDTSDGCRTPTHSTLSDDPKKDTKKDISESEHHPKAGKTFIITCHGTRKFICLVNGVLQVVDEPREGCFWHCVKKQGWYGFRNAVSGTYIGRNAWGGFIAENYYHMKEEYFMAMRHEHGGYVLLTRHGDELKEMAIGEEGKLLVERTEGGTAWDFVELGSDGNIPCSVL